MVTDTMHEVEETQLSASDIISR